MNDLFLELIDSLHTDFRKPYPPIAEIDFTTNKEDTLGFHNKKLAYLNKIDSLEKDSSKLIIYISKYEEPFEDKYLKQFLHQYRAIKVSDYVSDFEIIKSDKQSGIKSVKIPEYKPTKINLAKFAINRKYTFQFFDRFKKLKKDSLFLEKAVGGVISFSRIQLDDSKNYGFLTASLLDTNRFDSYGCIIFIKKTKGKWKIDKIEQTWIT